MTTENDRIRQHLNKQKKLKSELILYGHLMTESQVLKKEIKLSSFEAIGLNWYRPYIGNLKTFTVKDVEKMIALIAGEQDHTKFRGRALTIIRYSLYKKEILVFSKSANPARIRFAFEIAIDDMAGV